MNGAVSALDENKQLEWGTGHGHIESEVGGVYALRTRINLLAREFSFIFYLFILAPDQKGKTRTH